MGCYFPGPFLCCCFVVFWAGFTDCRYRNYWSDACLAKAVAGTPWQGSQVSLDFYQIHSYPSGGGFDPESPFVGKNKSYYGLDK